MFCIDENHFYICCVGCAAFWVQIRRQLEYPSILKVFCTHSWLMNAGTGWPVLDVAIKNYKNRSTDDEPYRMALDFASNEVNH